MPGSNMLESSALLLNPNRPIGSFRKCGVVFESLLSVGLEAARAKAIDAHLGSYPDIAESIFKKSVRQVGRQSI
jgi:hypothetical protein